MQRSGSAKMSSAPPDAGPTTLADLHALAEDGDVTGLKAEHGEAYLVYSGAAGQLRPAEKDWHSTMVEEVERVTGGSVELFVGTMPVYPIRHSGRTMTSLFITVGRVEASNDIVIADESISALHGIFERGADGGFLLRDMGSKNGTFVNDNPVANEPPTEVLSGDTVRFGSVALVFLLAEDILELVRNLSAE
jgi:hypothetical protein